MTPHVKLDEKAVEAARGAYEGFTGEATTLIALRHAIAAYLSAAHAPQGGVRVKPLTWKKLAGSSQSEAATGFGPVYIVYSNGPERWTWGMPGFSLGGAGFTSEADAYAAVEADYEARIHAALTGSDPQ